ncbi:MAG: serine-rich protein, partial [Chloroflexota bacterium]
STAVSQGNSENWGTAQTNSVANTNGSSHSTSVGQSIGGSSGWSQSVGSSDSIGHSVGTTVATPPTTMTVGHTDGTNVGGGVSGKLPFGIGAHGEAGMSASDSTSVTTPIAPGFSSSSSDSSAHVDSSSQGVSGGSSWANSTGESWGTMQSTTVGQADTASHGIGVSSSTTNATGSFESTSIGHAVTKSQADTLSEGWSEGGSHAVSKSDTVSDSTSTARGTTNSYGVSQSRGLSASESQGLAAGIAPSFSLSKSFVWKDEAAMTLTLLLEQQMNILKEAHEEGGFYSDAYILTRTANGQNVAEAAAVQAFGGSQGVVTHIQPRRPSSPEEREHLRRHAQCFTPSTLTETLGVINGYAFSTLLTPTQQAAYSTPGLFEEGTALTIQERTPPFAFNPDMRGDVVLGFQFSTERGELTDARLMMSEDRHFHSLFAADTGYGKTVAAERYAFEACKYWKHRVVVLDFGAGWRRMINAPLDRDRVDIYQLAPGSLRPFRWNFLQIGRRITPDQQWLATSELIANAGRMGPRQLGYIRRALRQLYVEHGVMPGKAGEDADIATTHKWQELQADEVDVIRADRARRGVTGLPDPIVGDALIGLRPEDRQAIAVHRSREVTVTMLHDRLNTFLVEAGRDQTAKTSLEGVLLRLEPFTQGELARMYSGSERNIAVENLGLLGPGEDSERYGMCILEGGAQMDDYAKALVLSLVAWHLYHDAFKRREQSIGGNFNRPLDIYFEEASKILSGVGGGATSDSASDKPTSTERWQEMWRDGRKYKVFLHPIVQTLHDLPPGIQSSCNNAFFSQIKDLKDRDLAMGHIGKSEKGFTDEEYKRFISRIPVALAVVKLGYSTDIADIEPMLMKPLLVPGVEPTNEEIARRFGVY